MNIIHMGLGPIGREVARLVHNDDTMTIVGAIDINPELKGKDLGELLNVDPIGVSVTDDAEELFKSLHTDNTVLMLTTVSQVERLKPQLELAAKYKLNVVSPSEELFYPEQIDAKIAQELHALAEDAGVTFVGRGVNPGCLMDTYPLEVIKQHQDVESATIYRHDNTAHRRAPLLKKTGAGLTVEEFNELNKEGKLGHVGLIMSAQYIADGLGYKNPQIMMKRVAAISDKDQKPDNGDTIPQGYATGIHESASIIHDGKVKINLDLQMHVGCENKNGVLLHLGKEIKYVDYGAIVNGDIATVRILHDCIKKVIEAKPGLNTLEKAPEAPVLLKK